MTLKDLRATLSHGERKLVKDSLSHIERDLILGMDRILKGVRTTRSQSSLSPTIALNPKGKKGWNVELTVDSRIRAKTEPFRGEYHITPEGELQLGFEDFLDGDGGGDEDEKQAARGASGGPPGFDDSAGDQPTVN